MAFFFNEIDYISYKMQRQLSSFDIYVIVSELQQLQGSYIDKIYQLTRNELLIRVKNIATKQKESIFVRNGELICITKKQFEMPLQPTTFATTLRKYLLNGGITEITQHEFDRIIKFKISKKEGDYTLVIEFFSDGNIILVNPEGKIILPLIKQQWAHRAIKGNAPYMPPPSQTNPFSLTKEKFADLIKESETDLVRTLAVNVNLSGLIAEEICKRAHVDKTVKIEDIDDETIDRVFTSLAGFLDLFKNKKFDPVFVKKDKGVIDILPFKFESYGKADFEKAENFTRGLEKFIDVKKPEKKITGEFEKKIGKLNRQLKQQQEAIAELNKKIEQKKLEGDLIYLNFKQCESLLNEISEVLRDKDKEEKIEKINEKKIVKDFDPLSNKLVVYLLDTSSKVFEVELDFRKSVADNAERAYDDSKKFKGKLAGARKSIGDTKKLIESVKKKTVVEEDREKKGVVSDKVFWFERLRWFISSDGNVVVGGRDAKSNEMVVKKYLRAGDRFVHADVHGAPSCVVKNEGVDDEKISISEKTLEEACVFSACYSKAWKQFAEAQAYWVLPEQVSKTPQSGEFLPKGGFVIRGKRNYCRCKLELAVGGILLDDIVKIMGGPVEAVKKRADRYIVLVPGDMKKSVVAHKLSKVFDISIDQIDRVLPPGGVNVVETVGFELS